MTTPWGPAGHRWCEGCQERHGDTFRFDLGDFKGEINETLPIYFMPGDKYEIVVMLDSTQWIGDAS